MKSEIFREMSRRYASIVGRRDNVEVEFRPGAAAWTNGKVIVVPDVPYGTILTDHQTKVFGGYLDHEAAHVRETNFKDIPDDNPQIKWLANLFEDIRIERLQIQRYAGLRPYLDALCNEVDGRPREFGPSKVTGAIYREVWETYRDVKVPQIPFTLDEIGLSSVKHILEGIPELESTRDCRKMAEKVLAELEAALERKKQEEAQKEAEKKAEQTKGPEPAPAESAEEEELDEEIADAMNNHGQNEPAEENKEQEDEAEEPDDGPEDEEDSEDSGEDSDEESPVPTDAPAEGSGEDDSEKEEAPGKDVEAGGEAEGGGLEGDDSSSAEQDGGASPGLPGDDVPEGQSSSPASETQESSEGVDQQAEDEKLSEEDLQNALDGMKEWGEKGVDERKEVLADALKGEEGETSDGEPAKPFDRNHAAHKKILPPACPSGDQIMVRPDLEHAISSRMVVQGNTSKLVRELIRVLQARDMRAVKRDQEDGDLDDEALYSVPTGNKRVYKQMRERRSLNTAVELVLDMSGSMNTNIVRIATEVLAKALNAVPRLKFEITGAKCSGSYHNSDFRNVNKSDIGRLDPMQFFLLKAFDEPISLSRKYLDALQCSGYTPLGEAYAIGMENIVRRREQKKILWVVTDGTPEFSVGNVSHSDYLLMEKIHKMCQKFEVLTVCLAIGNEMKGKMERYFDHVDYVSDHSQMIDTMLTLAEKMV